MSDEAARLREALAQHDDGEAGVHQYDFLAAAARRYLALIEGGALVIEPENGEWPEGLVRAVSRAFAMQAGWTWTDVRSGYAGPEAESAAIAILDALLSVEESE